MVAVRYVILYGDRLYQKSVQIMIFKSTGTNVVVVITTNITADKIFVD